MSKAKLANKVAIISGAGSGIGKAIAERFSAEGAAISCFDIDPVKADATAQSLRQANGKAIACHCDVSDAVSVQASIEQTVSALGGAHIVVCGAAVFTPIASVEQLSEADWQQALAVNVSGAFLVCKYSIPHLRKAGGGSIILIASQMGRVATAGQTAYCTTKGALLQLAKGMALDHVEDGIRVNALSPGGVATERLARRFGDLPTAEKVWGPKHPMGRLGQPKEVAAAALFLASEDSSFMTGADLLIDGGYSAV